MRKISHIKDSRPSCTRQYKVAPLGREIRTITKSQDRGTARCTNTQYEVSSCYMAQSCYSKFADVAK